MPNGPKAANSLSQPAQGAVSAGVVIRRIGRPGFLRAVVVSGTGWAQKGFLVAQKSKAGWATDWGRL